MHVIIIIFYSFLFPNPWRHPHRRITFHIQFSCLWWVSSRASSQRRRWARCFQGSRLPKVLQECQVSSTRPNQPKFSASPGILASLPTPAKWTKSCHRRRRSQSAASTYTWRNSRTMPQAFPVAALSTITKAYSGYQGFRRRQKRDQTTQNCRWWPVGLTTELDGMTTPPISRHTPRSSLPRIREGTGIPYFARVHQINHLT